MQTVNKRSIAFSAIQITIIMFIIKILGVVKQSIIAAICGATAETDAYFIASGIIIALCTVCFSSVSISFLSMHTQRLILEGRDSSNNLVNAVLRLFIPIAILISAIFIIFAPQLSKIFAPSYTAEQLKTLASYIRIIAPMFVFMGYTLIINVVLETEKLFLPGKIPNLIQNAMVIFAALLFYKKLGMAALLYAFIAAGILQCIQITFNARKYFHFKHLDDKETKELKYLMSLSFPLLIGNAIYEINDIVDKQISSGLGGGSVSVLSYGASINEIVTSVIIGSVSTVLFSHYATWVAENNTEKIENNLNTSLEALIVIIMPIMIMCFVCSDCIVTILYGRGSFNADAILRTSSVVVGYAMGFFFQAARANIVKVYYAFQDTKTPMINGAISVAANICMSILLSKIIGVSGIALATSLSMLLVTLLLLPQIKKYLPNFTIKSTIPELLKTIVIGIIVGGSAYILRRAINQGVITSFVIIGIYVVVTFIVLGYLIRVRCIRQFAVHICQRFINNKDEINDK